MKVVASKGIENKHPELESTLWEVACLAKNEDPDIKLMGLLVRVKRSPRPKWYAGLAHPREESFSYGKRLIHPAGRIDLCMGDKVDELDKVILFSHELRHIGQFHRGRKLRGILTADYMGDSDIIEEDCYDFESEILDQYLAGNHR